MTKPRVGIWGLSLVLLASSCGGSSKVCERIQAANDRFFSGTCLKGCNSTTRGDTLYCPASKVDFSRTACEEKLRKCNARDLKLLDAYATCFENLPTCEEGGFHPCAFPTILDLSAECTFKEAEFVKR